MCASSKRQSFLTAFPWLCTGKPAPSSASSNNLPQSPTFNPMPQFQAEITSPTRQSNQTPATKVIFQQSILDSRHTGQSSLKNIDEATLNIHENDSTFMSEDDMNLYDLKRKMVDILSNKESAISVEDDVDSISEPNNFHNIDVIGLPKNGEQPNFILCETLCNNEIVDRLKIRLGFENCFTVPAQGRKGRLAFLWKISSDAHLLKFSAHHIDMEVHIPGYDHWRLTGFYGEPNRSLRHTTWELLRDLADDSNLPWCIIGDFNNITTHEDKKGGLLYPESLINGFNAALHDCRLCELQLRGHRYTWERGKGTQNHIEIRLDKAFATQSWLTIFNEASLSNFDFSSSDHTPIFLEPAPAVMSKPITILRYENAWSREPLCGQIVQNCWEANVHLSLVDKAKLCLETLINWGRDLTGHFKKRLSNTQQEIYWKQRSKQFWLNGRDKNSKYFHATASSRKRNNQIVQLQDNDGVWKGWKSGLDQVIVDYFLALYATDRAIYGSVVNGICHSVTAEENDSQLCPITAEEVKQAIFQMYPDKAPGPNGMSPDFYQ
ncbi:uncharacterized protein LOC133035873 [Cannabis sativa]|uniref:uncharacterized protein LOC133035873 n=1 Tax=Cannabis sativa TaxID=3483 RepID=UPI0029CA0E5B|nr:uncharacterized protein LOC133035873 [Cannabis sativa]